MSVIHGSLADNIGLTDNSKSEVITHSIKKLTLMYFESIFTLNASFLTSWELYKWDSVPHTSNQTNTVINDTDLWVYSHPYHRPAINGRMAEHPIY